MGCRIDHIMLMGGALFSGKGFEFDDPLDFIPEKLDTDRGFRFGQVDVHHIPAYPEFPAVKIHVVTVVLQFHETFQHLAPGKPLSDPEEHQHLAVFLRGADPVDTGNAGDDDHIPAFQHGTGCRKTQTVEFIVQ